MKKYLEIEPVRSLAALLAFGSAIIVIIGFKANIEPEVIASIQGAWAAFIALLGSFFTRNQVTPLADPHAEDGTPLTK